MFALPKAQHGRHLELHHAPEERSRALSDAAWQGGRAPGSANRGAACPPLGREEGCAQGAAGRGKAGEPPGGGVRAARAARLHRPVVPPRRRRTVPCPPSGPLSRPLALSALAPLPQRLPEVCVAHAGGAAQEDGEVHHEVLHAAGLHQVGPAQGLGFVGFFVCAGRQAGGRRGAACNHVNSRRKQSHCNDTMSTALQVNLVPILSGFFQGSGHPLERKKASVGQQGQESRSAEGGSEGPGRPNGRLQPQLLRHPGSGGGSSPAHQAASPSQHPTPCAGTSWLAVPEQLGAPPAHLTRPTHSSSSPKSSMKYSCRAL